MAVPVPSSLTQAQVNLFEVGDMKFIVLVVEGPTEEFFVNEVLAPVARAKNTHLQPIVVHTSSTPTRTAKGGGGWKHYSDTLRDLSRQGHWHKIALIMDYYGLPHGVPGADILQHSAIVKTGAKPAKTLSSDTQRRHTHILQSLRDDIGDSRFHPCIMLHEFETLVLAAIDAGSTQVHPSAKQKALRHVVAEHHGNVERVNDGPDTSPSHRITAAWPGYNKVIDGPRVIASVDFERILTRCPTFTTWWEELLA